jgi:hypothetical protein
LLNPKLQEKATYKFNKSADKRTRPQHATPSPQAKWFKNAALVEEEEEEEE